MSNRRVRCSDKDRNTQVQFRAN